MRVFVPVVSDRDLTVQSPFQSRKHYDEGKLLELVQSIEAVGQIADPKARLVNANLLGLELTDETERAYSGFPDCSIENELRTSGWRVQFAVGHRRREAWRRVWQRHAERARDLVEGAGVVGIEGVPVGHMPVDLEPLNVEEMARMEQDENDKREPVSAVERAEGWEARIEILGMTHDDIADEYGYSRPAVTNTMRLLKLPEQVRQMVRDGRIASESKARALVPLWSLDGEDERIAREADLACDGTDTRLGIAKAAIEATSAADVTVLVEAFLRDVELAAAEAQREREPEIFQPEETEPVDQVGPESGAPHGDILDEWSEELERVRQAYTTADAWRSQPSDVQEAGLVVLASTIDRLQRAAADLRTLEETAPASLTENQRGTLGRVRRGIETDLQTYRAEVDRRSAAASAPAASVPADEWDDDGAGLGRVVETVGADLGVAPMATDDAPTPGPLPEADEDLAIEERTSPATGVPAVEVEGDTLVEPEPATLADALRLPSPVLDEPHLWSAPRPRWPEGHERDGKQLLSREIYDLLEAYHLPTLDRYGVDAVSKSSVKEDITYSARRAVQHVANLRCAYVLTTPQLDALAAWADVQVAAWKGGKTYEWDWFKSSPVAAGERPMAVAAIRVRDEMLRVQAAGILEGDALDQFEASMLRTLASFVYHLFHASTQETPTDIGQEAEPSGPVGEAAGVPAPDRQSDSASGGTSQAIAGRHPEGSAPDEGSEDPGPADGAEHEAHEATDETHEGVSRARAFEGVARVPVQLGNGFTEFGVERFFDHLGHQWAVVPATGAAADAAEDLLWNVAHTGAGMGLRIAAESPGEAEAAARTLLDGKGREAIDTAIERCRSRFGVPVETEDVSTETSGAADVVDEAALRALFAGDASHVGTVSLATLIRFRRNPDQVRVDPDVHERVVREIRRREAAETVPEVATVDA
ncbi:hypothetical protein B1759_15110 [Rubrivirga sp. SAORIC476]|uniref:ParB/RepB/Spo0J family partition protein n=1 Tax=Rubrivirga sp. SAORIC476 TaxID=1961794 RepID=UPI000BA93556|nr:hypothetical protein [Rubrivirga sp. SAORIC476]PAP79646.1 hypothetical protein B1759_15110 [Rubrivirga sp. SAORIC476]